MSKKTYMITGGNSGLGFETAKNLYFTYELNRRLRAKGSKIMVSALDPGFMRDTSMSQGRMRKERIEEMKRAMPERSSKRSYIEENAKEIWNLSDRLTGMEGESL